MLNKKFFCFLIVFYSSSTYSQQEMDSLLLLVFNKPTINFSKQNIEKYNRDRKGLTAIETIEMGTQANGFQFSRQVSNLSISLNSLGQVRAQKVKSDALKSLLEVQIDKDILETITDQYQNIIELLQLNESLILKRKLMQVFIDKKNLYINSKILIGDETLLHILRNDFDIKTLELEIKDTEMKFKVLKSKVLKYSTKEELPDLTAALPISAELIINNLEQWNANTFDNPTKRNLQSKIADIEADMSIIKSESHKIIDEIKIRYRNFVDKYDIRDYSVGTSFLIPYKSSLNAKSSNKLIELLSLKNSLYQIELQTIEKIHLLKQNILANYELYTMATHLFENSTSDLLLKNIPEEALQNPITLLYAKEIQISTQMKQLSPKYNILKNYIDLQSNLGNLSKLPLVNYLSMDLHIVQN